MRANPGLSARLVPFGVLLLLALGAAGLATLRNLELTITPVPDDRAWAVLVAASVAWIIGGTAVLTRASVDGGWRRPLRVAVVVNVVLTAAAVVLLLAGRVPPPPGASEATTTATRPPERTIFIDALWMRWVFLALLVAVVVGAVLLVVLAGWFNRSRFFLDRGRIFREHRYDRGRRLGARPEDVLEAVVRARRALLGDEDSRRAIIAAYGAMEHAIAERGVTRLTTQTPREFLQRALTDGVLADREATDGLLRQFQLARFSRRPLPADAAAITDRWLAALQAELAGVRA